MKKNDLHQTRRYYSPYHEILSFTETHIWDKWYHRNAEDTTKVGLFRGYSYG